MKKSSFKEKITDVGIKLKAYWNKPPKGYDVSYKEFLSFSLGSGSISFINVLTQWTGLAMGIHMMISYFKVPTGLMWVLGIVAALITLIRSPILSMVIDNSNSKNGKFKPFLFWSTFASAVCFCLIPFVPKDWNAISLFSFSIPAIPIMGVLNSSSVSVSLAVLIMFILLQLGGTFSTLLNQALSGVEQTISTVAQERANIGALKNIVGNLPGSIVNIIIPVLAANAFSKLGGWNSIELYRWVFPFTSIGAMIFIMFVIKGTKERVVVNKKYVARVKFFEGAKELSKNKYFWIMVFNGVFFGIRALSNLTTWITQYSFFTEQARTWVGLFCSTILMNVLVIGNVLGPMLVKKFGKKNVMIYSYLGFAIMVAFQLLVYKNPILMLLAALLQNVFGGLYFISGIMVSDILDYQQWKTGKRLEGFWQNYSTFITTIIGIFTGMLAPAFLAMAGIGFSDNISEALQNTTLRDNAYKYQTILALIGAVLVIPPFFFYDLTEKKHANYVRVLKIRAAIDNYDDNLLEDRDVLNIKEIYTYAQEHNDSFLWEEINYHNQIHDIMGRYDEVFARVTANKEKEEKAELERKLELESIKIQKKLEKAKLKAMKNNEEFDEKEFLDKYNKKSK